MNYESSLGDLAAADDRIIVMTAENRASIRGLPSSLGRRFVDVGICEQTMIGVAAGLALRGRIPVAHALAAFLTMRAFEFIRTDIGIARLPVKLMGAVPGFLSEANGPTHQAIEDIALMRGIPHMQVVCPADQDELFALLPVILESREPCYVRYNACEATVPHSAFLLGKAEALSQGEDVAILTYGHLVNEVARSANILQARGVSVCLLNLRSLQPIDEEAILDAASSTGFVVTVEDHFVTGGLYSIVAEILVRRGVRAKVIPLGLEERWFRPGLLRDVLSFEGFTGEQMADKVFDLLRHRTRLVSGGYK